MPKKLLCILLATLCIANPILAKAEDNAPNADIVADVTNDDELHKIGLSPDPIYVDGVLCNIDINFLTGDIIVTGETKTCESTLVLEHDGDAVAELESNMGEDETYTLDINDLSKDSVDIEVYDETGDKVAEYDEFEDLIEEEYEGQDAITVGLYIGLVLLLYITAQYVIVRNNRTCVGSKSFTKAIDKAAEAVRKKAISYYYPAFIIKNPNGKNAVYIDPNGININEAAALVIADASVYSFDSKMAKKVINRAGFAAVNSDGTKTYDWHTNSKGTQFKHYHKGKTTKYGTLKKFGKCHSLFGAPKTVK